jgi:hypothetical protein
VPSALKSLLRHSRYAPCSTKLGPVGLPLASSVFVMTVWHVAQSELSLICEPFVGVYETNVCIGEVIGLSYGPKICR